MWVTKRLEKDELQIEPKAMSLLLNTTGLSLGRIRAGCDVDGGGVRGRSSEDEQRDPQRPEADAAPT